MCGCCGRKIYSAIYGYEAMSFTGVLSRSLYLVTADFSVSSLDLNQRFSSGTSDGIQCLDITINLDRLIEDTEVFFVVIRSEDLAAVITTNTTTISIHDLSIGKLRIGIAEKLELPQRNFSMLMGMFLLSRLAS